MQQREIERKFLVVGDSWRTGRQGKPCRQGYVLFGPPVSVRVRVMGDRGYLTLKRASEPDGSADGAIERLEFEYEIPADEAAAMLEALCEAEITKTRYLVPFAGRNWEVDEFHGANEGLTVAEIELESPNAGFQKPPWLGRDVSGDVRYLNVNLARRPFREWAANREA